MIVCSAMKDVAIVKNRLASCDILRLDITKTADDEPIRFKVSKTAPGISMGLLGGSKVLECARCSGVLGTL